jgi:hypothetical protein
MLKSTRNGLKMYSLILSAMRLMALCITYPFTKKSKVKGYSVVSAGDYSNVDALKAFEKLILFTAFSNKFFSIGEQRAKISEDYFYTPANYIADYLQNDNHNIYLSKGREILVEFGDIQKELKELIKEYSHHYDHHICKINRIDDKKYERLIEALVHLDRIQYLQGHKLVENVQDLKLVKK